MFYLRLKLLLFFLNNVNDSLEKSIAFSCAEDIYKVALLSLHCAALNEVCGLGDARVNCPGFVKCASVCESVCRCAQGVMVCSAGLVTYYCWELVSWLQAARCCSGCLTARKFWVRSLWELRPFWEELPVTVWALSRFCSFLPQPKDIHLLGDS